MQQAENKGADAERRKAAPATDGDRREAFDPLHGRLPS